MNKLLQLTTIITLLLGNSYSGRSQCLVAKYMFSGNAADSSGNGHHAVVNGATLSSDRYGNQNSAYEFNGSGDFIDTKTSFDYQDRTVSVWAMTYDQNSERKILDQDAASLTYGAVGTTFKNGAIKGNPGGNPNVLLSNPNNGQWYHIVLVRNATNAYMYVDGKLRWTGSPTSNGSSNNPNTQMQIGTYRGQNGLWFYGKIDDVMIFNCAMDSNEVKGLYNNVEEIKNINFKVYPNPMKDYTTIQFDNPGNETYNLILTDVTGKIVRRKQITGSKAVIYKKELTNGNYFYQLIKDNKVYVKGKLLIE